MQKRYKNKRERKNKKETTNENGLKTIIITASSVVLFIGLFYGLNLILTKMGAFEEGYTKPIKTAAEINYDEILYGNVFNKPEKTYYVIFDTYSDLTNNVYIEYLISSKEYSNKIYKVDLSNPMNKNINSDKSNKKASKPSELEINDTTLIKISSGKITNYIIGDEKIETYLEKLSK